MTPYLQLQENEIVEAVRKYNLEPIGYEPIEEGAGNTSYLLRTTQRRYILTIHEIEKIRVIKLCKLLNMLEKYEFPTTRVEKMANGEIIATIRGKPAMLKSYIIGQVVKVPDEDMIAQVGTALGKLHQIPKPDYLPEQHAYGLETFHYIVDQGLNVEYEKWLGQRYDFIQKTLPAGLPQGLIHGDVFYDNVLFEGQKFKAIIDFEEACNYYKVFDLGMAIVGMCSEQMQIQLPKVQSLIHGYQKIRKLEGVEQEVLKVCIEYAAVATSAWRFWKYNIDTPTTEKSEKHQAMIGIAMNANAISNDVFINSVFS